MSNPDFCKPYFDENGRPAMLTIMGDSRGDFADWPTYGWYGWEFYFKLTVPEADWDIQNLAVWGRRTADVANELLHCARNGKTTYKTANKT